MKKYLISVYTTSILLIACQSIPKADKGIVSSQQPVTVTKTLLTYQVDTTTSKIIWTGTKPVGQHIGTFKIQQGVLALGANTIDNGKFIIDISSLTDMDLTGNLKRRLEEHLKSKDFFDVEKYPVALFEITRCIPFDSTKIESLLPGATHLLSGNLTLKGVVKNVTFPASVVTTEKSLQAKAHFILDRTEWGLSYGNDKSLQDRFIRPEVSIELDIKATRQL